MPRIRQNAAQYQKDDFLLAIRTGQALANLMHKNALAQASGIPYTTLWTRLDNPDSATAEELRKLVTTIPIDPGAMLAFLGYSQKDIKKFKDAPM